MLTFTKSQMGYFTNIHHSSSDIGSEAMKDTFPRSFLDSIGATAPKLRAVVFPDETEEAAG